MAIFLLGFIFGLVGLCMLGWCFSRIFRSCFSDGFHFFDCSGLPFRLGSEVINCLNSSKKSSRLLGSFILRFDFIFTVISFPFTPCVRRFLWVALGGWG